MDYYTPLFSGNIYNMDDDLLRDRLCSSHCSYYKPGREEELSCLGYRAAGWLIARGMEIDLDRRETHEMQPCGVLESDLCPHCPFYTEDCDYAAKVDNSPPCGGVSVLGQLLREGRISADDIRDFISAQEVNEDGMRIYNMAEMALDKGGEFVLGSAELLSHACYMIFGILKPGEKKRIIRPGGGHEEICCLVSGTVSIYRKDRKLSVGAGQAFHLRDEDAWLMDNDGSSEAVYVIAGGHSGPHAHH